MIKGGHTPELGKPGGRGGIWRGGLGEHGDGEREDDQEATGRWDPDRGVAFGATPQADDALRGAHARVPRAARGAVRRADELPGERAANSRAPCTHRKRACPSRAMRKGRKSYCTCV